MSSEQRPSSVPISLRSGEAWQQAPTVEPDFVPPFASGEILRGKYRIEELVGVGGVGFVMSATNIGLDEQVALKFLRPEYLTNEEAVSRFTAEARLACKIQSPHVARVLDIEALPETGPFIVMELLVGRDLNQILNDEGPLPVEQAVDYLRQACEALSAAHACDIVHRDVKPENLFLARQQRGPALIKILDFGISKLQLAQPVNGKHASQLPASAVLGSPSYMSPEQVRGAANLDARADVWSLGCVLYELLTGKHAFYGANLLQICAAVLEQPPSPLCAERPDVCRALETVVLRCLEKDPEQRYRDVAALSRALEPFSSARARVTASWKPMMPDEVTLRLPAPGGVPAFASQGTLDDAALADAVPPEPAPASGAEAELVVYSPPSTAPVAIDAAPRGRGKSIVPVPSPRRPRKRRRRVALGVGLASGVGALAALLALRQSDAPTPSPLAAAPLLAAEATPHVAARAPSAAPLSAPRPSFSAATGERPSAAAGEPAISTRSAQRELALMGSTVSVKRRSSPPSEASPSVGEISAAEPSDALEPTTAEPAVTADSASLAAPRPAALPNAAAVIARAMVPAAAAAASLNGAARRGDEAGRARSGDAPRPAPNLGAVARAHSARIQACFERVGLDYERFRGKVTIEAVLDPAGNVVHASAPAALDAGVPLARCLSLAARSWKFPERPGATGLATYRLLLE